MTAPAWAGECNSVEASTFKGEIHFEHQGKSYTLTDLPQFDHFRAANKGTAIAKDIDWSSHKQAWNYRTRLREGLNAPVDFNGHYKVVTHGCGSGCQRSWIVDQTTGKVLADLTTGLGIHYCKNSSLIATDLTSDSTTQELIEYQPPEFGTVVFYQVKDSTLERVKDVDLFKDTGLRQ